MRRPRSRSLPVALLAPLVAALCAPAMAAPLAAQGAAAPTDAEIARRVDQVMTKVVAWRRDIHEHPELGYQEKRTAALVADHLRKLGYEVRTGVGRTGVVAVLRGGRCSGAGARARWSRCAPTWTRCR
jgi:hypothetical protein